MQEQIRLTKIQIIAKQEHLSELKKTYLTMRTS